ncbi:hypothetical protein FRC01_000869 [Tulasnella sp. 417]|nr:hypothetical protein FRC01_000869 [Tulasnella sp. 417]
MTGNVPYSAKKSAVAVMVEIYNGSAPGSVSALASLVMDPAVDPACRAGVSSLQSIISQCWELEPTGRPSASSVWKSIAIPFQGGGDLGAWKDQEAGIESLRIGHDSGHQEDESVGRRKPRANPDARKSRRGGSRKGRQSPNDVAETIYPIASSPTHPKDRTVGKQMVEAHPEPQKADRNDKQKVPWKALNDVAERYPIASSPAHPQGAATRKQAMDGPEVDSQGDRSHRGDILRTHSDRPSQEDTRRPQFPEPNRQHKHEAPQQIAPNSFPEKAPVAASNSSSQNDSRRRRSPEPNQQHKQEVLQQVPSYNSREKASVAASKGPSQEDPRQTQSPEPNRPHTQEVPQQVPSNNLREKAPVAASKGPSQEDPRQTQSPQPNRRHKQEVAQQVPPNSFREKSPVMACDGPPQEDPRQRRSPEPHRQHKQEGPSQENELRRQFPGKQMVEAHPEPQEADRGSQKKDPWKAPNDVAKTRYPITSSPVHPKDGTVGKPMAEAHRETQKADRDDTPKDPRKGPNDVVETRYPVTSSPAHPQGLFKLSLNVIVPMLTAVTLCGLVILVMSSEPSYEALEAIFKEVTHLLIARTRLTRKATRLGHGGFGEVCLATLDESSESPRQVAIKELLISFTERERIPFVRIAIPAYVPSRLSQIQRLARELKVWAKLKHPNILELIGYDLTANHDSALFVSEFMANGNVAQYVQRSSASVVVRLKFANVLVNQRLDAVLCDFGLSSFIHESGAGSGLTTLNSAKGSSRYMSPELLQENESKHTLESDVWAWGCTAFEIMTGNVPYSTKKNDFAVMMEICTGSAPGSVSALASLVMDPAVDSACLAGVSSLQSIIHRCWEPEPTGRPSTSSVWNSIAIPFREEAGLRDPQARGAGIPSPSIGDNSRHQKGEAASNRPSQEDPRPRRSPEPPKEEVPQHDPVNSFREKDPVTPSDGPSEEDLRPRRSPEPPKEEVPQEDPVDSFREKDPVTPSDGPSEEDLWPRRSPKPLKEEVPQEDPVDSFREKDPVTPSDGPSEEDLRPRRPPEPPKEEVPQQDPVNSFREKDPVPTSNGSSQKDPRRPPSQRLVKEKRGD